MNIISGWAGKARGFFADSKGPWGPSGGAGSGNGGGNGSEPPTPGPSSPWGKPAEPRRPGAQFGNVTSLDDFLTRSKARFGGGGGGGGGFGGRKPDRAMFVWGAIGLVLLWLLFTTVHRVAPEERGVVTQLGRYSRTLGPGIGLSLPAPFERVQKVDVENIRNIDIGSAQAETLMLTGDQNIIDIAYSIRWNVRDPELYLFELQDPGDTIRQVAESTMRASLSEVTLDEAIGQKRGEIEARVREQAQRVLDAYRSGVVIQGVSIKQADPPAAVNEAFKDVSAAQQSAQSDINNSRAYALQIRQLSQGEATAFDKVFEQYRLAPEVTRRRMYYETMEAVLAKSDKTIVEPSNVVPYLQSQGARRLPDSVPAAPAAVTPTQPVTTTGGGQ